MNEINIVTPEGNQPDWGHKLDKQVYMVTIYSDASYEQMKQAAIKALTEEHHLKLSPKQKEGYVTYLSGSIGWNLAKDALSDIDILRWIPQDKLSKKFKSNYYGYTINIEDENFVGKETVDNIMHSTPKGLNTLNIFYFNYNGDMSKISFAPETVNETLWSCVKSVNSVSQKTFVSDLIPCNKKARDLPKIYNFFRM